MLTNQAHPLTSSQELTGQFVGNESPSQAISRDATPPLSDSLETRDVGSPFVSMPAIPMSVNLTEEESQNLEKVFFFKEFTFFIC